MHSHSEMLCAMNEISLVHRIMAYREGRLKNESQKVFENEYKYIFLTFAVPKFGRTLFF